MLCCQGGTDRKDKQSVMKPALLHSVTETQTARLQCYTQSQKHTLHGSFIAQWELRQQAETSAEKYSYEESSLENF